MLLSQFTIMKPQAGSQTLPVPSQQKLVSLKYE